MKTMTVGETIDRTGIDVLSQLDREAEIPLHTGMIRQGDVIVIPNSELREAKGTIPNEGFPVVKGENGGNTHALLVESGSVFFDPKAASTRDLMLGTLTVKENSVAVLAHPEHAFTRLGTGTYEIRRQREQADEIRIVAD